MEQGSFRDGTPWVHIDLTHTGGLKLGLICGLQVKGRTVAGPAHKSGVKGAGDIFPNLVAASSGTGAEKGKEVGGSDGECEVQH